MTAPETFVPWKVCKGCGRWQRPIEGVLCADCQGRCLEPEDLGSGVAVFRVLIDCQLRHGSTWQITGLRSSMLPISIEHTRVLGRLNDKLHVLFNAQEPASSPSVETWERLRDSARGIIAEELKLVLETSWNGLLKPSPAPVAVAMRLMILDPYARHELPWWIEQIPFESATMQKGSELRGGVEIDTSRTLVGFARGGDRVEISVSSPSEVMIDKCAIGAGSREVVSDWGFALLTAN